MLDTKGLLLTCLAAALSVTLSESEVKYVELTAGGGHVKAQELSGSMVIWREDGVTDDKGMPEQELKVSYMSLDEVEPQNGTIHSSIESFDSVSFLFDGVTSGTLTHSEDIQAKMAPFFATVVTASLVGSVSIAENSGSMWQDEVTMMASKGQTVLHVRVCSWPWVSEDSDLDLTLEVSLTKGYKVKTLDRGQDKPVRFQIGPDSDYPYVDISPMVRRHNYKP